ncbi:MAG: LD-carboxypeptidase [Ignavibacteriae bacterium]|nr:LD-carboxypeptidase [Ignavibacteriota bacterium]
MKTIKPKKLLQNDLIGIISPASTPNNLDAIQNGVNYLEKLGYRTKIGKNVGKKHGYLAGTDKERLDDFHEMFADKNVKAIFCVRGGYGSGRLLEKIDFNIVKKNPKIFVGYSDITALQLSIFNKTGLVTFAGPMVASDFSGEINEFAEENFWKVLTSTKKIGKLHNPRNEKFFILNSGRAEGKILGGNLSLLISLMGTEYFPELKNSILLIEEIGEEPYRVDRMLNQLKLAKIFKNVKGIILGRFVDCYEKKSEENHITLNEVIENYFAKLKIPVIYSFNHGHIKENLTIPFGINCILNATRSFVEIPESAVL